MVLNTLCGCLPARVALALLCSTGVIVMYMIRINLSVAIVAMVHVPTTKNATKDKLCVPNIEDGHSIHAILGASNDSFELLSSEIKEDKVSDMIIMTSMEKGSVLGALYYGYVTTPIIGGRMAEMYGTKHVLGVSILASAVLTLLTPVAANTHYAFFTTVRVLIGIAQGVFYPALGCLISCWIPPLERPRFMSFVYLSNCLGIVITMPLCGVIIDAVGWPWVFYGSGILSLVWVILWTLLMHATPHQHPRISQAELKYIADAISHESNAGIKPKSVPWLEIMRCRGFLAITIIHTGNVYGWNLLNTQLPSFMDQVLGLSIKKNAVMSSIPYLTRFIGSNCWSWMGDTLLTKGIITPIISRKLFSAIGMVGLGTVLGIVGFVGCNVNLVVTLLSIGTTCLGANISGYGANHFDLAPNFAGTMQGICSTCAFLVGMLAPVIVGALTPDQTPEQWQAAFLLTTGILLFGITVYLIFADTEIKPWNFAPIKETELGEEEEERKEFVQKKAHGHGSVVSLQEL